MSEENNNSQHTSCSGVQEVAQGVTTLIQNTKQEIGNFEKKQLELYSLMNAVLVENQRLKYELDLSNRKIEDMQKQLQTISKSLEAAQKDRDNLLKIHESSIGSIKSMQIKLKSLRVHKVEREKQNQMRIIEILEHRIMSQQVQLKQQAELIQTLQQWERGRSFSEQEKSDAVQKIINEQQSKIDSLESRLAEATTLAAQHEEKLQYVHAMLEESLQQEQQVMAKVQDAIMLTQAAVNEKIDAENKARIFQEESAQLAESIGGIMDEASKQYDNKLLEKDQQLAVLREKLVSEMDQHQAELKLQETRYNNLESKNKETMWQNAEMMKQVNLTGQRLKELEQIANKAQSIEMEVVTVKKKFASRMERYLSCLDQVRASCKEEMEDLTKQFEKEIYRLKKKNGELQLENSLLKGSGDGCRVLQCTTIQNILRLAYKHGMPRAIYRHICKLVDIRG